MQRLSSYFLFTLVALNYYAQAQLVEVQRDCEYIPCVDNEETTIELSCGNSGEEITKVFFASYGLPSGSCPLSGLEELGASDLNFSATTGCDLALSKTIIEDACVGKVSCEVDIAQAVSNFSDGLGSCGSATLVFSVAVECNDPFDLFTYLAAGVVALIGLALGATVTVEMFKETFQEHRRAVIIGWLSQFGFMPLIAYLYVLLFDIEPLVALGAILTGSVPGGTTSNLMTYYAKGNVALSIIMSAASTICAFFMIPFLLYLYGTVALGFDESVSIPYVDIVLTLLIAVVPVAIGVLIRENSVKWAVRVEVVGSVLGLLFLLAALVTGILENPDLFQPSKYPKTWIGAALFQWFGAFFGFILSKLFRLTGPEIRAVVLETGIQNYTLAIAITAISFSGCTRSIVNTFILSATFWYIINSGLLTLILRYTAKYDSVEEEEAKIQAMKEAA